MSLGLGITNEPLETPTDWIPTDEGLGTRLQLWLQNNVGVSVNRWIDSSSNSNDALQTTEANQASAINNGGLAFDQSGTDKQYLDLTSSISITENGEFSLFFAARLDELTNETILSDSNSEFIEILRENQFRFKGNVPSAKTSVLKTDATPFSTNPMIVSLIRPTNGVLEWYVDGDYVELNASTTNGTNTAGFDFQNIGSRNDSDRFLDGTIMELIFYTQRLEGNQLTRMHTYLKEKFNIS